MHTHTHLKISGLTRQQRKARSCLRFRSFNFYVVGPSWIQWLSSCSLGSLCTVRRRTGERKKVYMKMRAGLCSQWAHLAWRSRGGGRGMAAEQRLGLSVQLCDPEWPGAETPEPRGLTEASPPSALTSKTGLDSGRAAGTCPSVLRLCAVHRRDPTFVCTFELKIAQLWTIICPKRSQCLLGWTWVVYLSYLL